MKNKNRIISLFMAVMFCITAFSFSASASDYYSSDESGNMEYPDYIESISVSTEGVSIPESARENTYELTPDGNLTLIDDYYEQTGSDEISQKQFLTVTTKGGNTFYIVVDRNGNEDNVYLLNLVDEADLMALINDEKVSVTTTEPTTAEEETTAKNEPEGEKTEKKSNSGLILFIVVALGGGGFAFYWFKIRNAPGKSQSVNTNDFDSDESDTDDETDNEEDDDNE